MKKKMELAEKILRQAEICRKLETEEEKILPFYAETVTQEELEAAGGTWAMIGHFILIDCSPRSPHR